MVKIAVVIGSTRPGRCSRQVADWVLASAIPRGVAGFETLDLAEYNHSVPGVLKNAPGYLYAEWNNQAAGFVSYGDAGGVRAVENLPLIAGELQMADVRAQGAVPFATDFGNFTTCTPTEAAEEAPGPLRDQLIAWATALKTLHT